MTTIYKMTYVDVQDRDSLSNQYEDYIHVTDYGTYEVMADDIRQFEDDNAELRQNGDLECSPYYVTFKRQIGYDKYDMLLNNELDLILLV